MRTFEGMIYFYACPLSGFLGVAIYDLLDFFVLISRL